MIEFGNRVKQLRKQKELTQEQLAKRLWVTKSIISAYESGAKFPSLDMLIKLAYTFGVTTDYLLGVNKKHYIDVSNLSSSQLEILNRLIYEFTNESKVEI